VVRRMSLLNSHPIVDAWSPLSLGISVTRSMPKAESRPTLKIPMLAKSNDFP